MNTQKIKEIAKDFATGITDAAALADRHGLAKSTIEGIPSRHPEIWNMALDERGIEKRTFRQKPTRQMDAEKLKQIQGMWESLAPLPARKRKATITKKLEMSKSTLHRYLKRLKLM